MDIQPIPDPPVEAVRWVDDHRVVMHARIGGVDMIVPDDPDNMHRRIITRWQETDMLHHKINDPPPPLVSTPETISDRQFFQQLAIQKVITRDEALAAVRAGTLPAALEQLVQALPAEQRFGAEMIVSGAVEFRRHSPLVVMIAEHYGWTAEQTDALWRAASAL